MGGNSAPLGKKLLVTGAGGRIGRLLRLAWAGLPAGAVIWQSRVPQGADGLSWDFGAAPVGAWPEGAVILHLAGVTRGGAEAMEANVRLARALAARARDSGAAQVLFASTAAVYGPADGLLTEETAPRPVSDYGRSKLAAEAALASGLQGSGTGLTCLRIGNIAGADALLGGAAQRPGQPVVLDPVAGQPLGPERSYLGPITLAELLLSLCGRADDLPAVLNIAQPGVVAMGALLQAAGLAWQFGPPRAETLARVELATARLEALLPVAPAQAGAMVAELSRLKGLWP